MNPYKIIILFLVIICLILVCYIRVLTEDNKDLMNLYIDSTKDMMNKKQTEEGEN